MQTLEKSKATQTTTRNQFRSSKSVKWTAELFEFQRVNFATENLTYANTTEVSRETKSNQQSISYARCAEDGPQDSSNFKESFFFFLKC